MISEVVSDNTIRHERENTQILSDVREEDRAGARQVVVFVNNLRLTNPKEVSLRNYDKYERLMLGTEDEDSDSQDPSLDGRDEPLKQMFADVNGLKKRPK